MQKYIFVKKQYFYNLSICKKAAFLHKNDAFLQGPLFYATYIYIFLLGGQVTVRACLINFSSEFYIPSRGDYKHLLGHLSFSKL